MERYPLVVCACAMALGAVSMLPLQDDARLLVPVCIGAMAIPLFVGRQSRALRVAFVLALAAGVASAAFSEHSERSVRAAAITLRCAQLEAQGDASFTCLASDERVYLVHAPFDVVPGRCIASQGRLEPFDGPRNQGEPDMRELQRERGIFAQFTTSRFSASDECPEGDYRVAIARAHAWAGAQFRARLPSLDAAILSGELYGSREALPPDVRHEFQETGTVHVLVTAGLHLGVICLLLTAGCRALRLPRTMASAVCIAAVWCYAVFSGLHLPVTRAASMATYAFMARAFGAKALNWNAIAFALIVVATFEPFVLPGASALLSFSCVAGIIALAPSFEHLLERTHLPAAAREAIVLTVSTQLATWPLTASTFLAFSTSALLANLCIVPFVGTSMLLGAAQLIASPVAPLAQAFANLNAWVLAWIVGAVSFLSTFPFSHVSVTPAPAWCIVLYDCSVFAAVRFYRTNATSALAVVLMATCLIVEPPRAANYDLRITAIDVGQADALLIRTPSGHDILVDAGGRLERLSGGESTAERVGEAIVLPFLIRSGIHQLDAIILSHPHGDHVGGFAPVLRNLRVNEFADGGQQYPGAAYADALATAKAHNVPMLYPRAGNLWRTDDGVTLTFIGPSMPFITNSRNDINNNSVAFLLQYRNFRMLFTGDAGAEAEQRFLAEGVDLHADVLKVGHHGSAYSSTPAFINAVHPRYALISVGRHNLFGHPAQSTLQTLQSYGAHVLRTDENGAVTIITDGQTVIASALLKLSQYERHTEL